MEGGEYNFKEELVRYCIEDVRILRLAATRFRNTYFYEFDVDPFVECTTIASTCMRVFRKNFLKKDQIGLIPNGGYRNADTQSRKALQWLLWMEKKVLDRPMVHAARGREKRTILGIPVDGFCEPLETENHKGIVLSFLGDFWHGNVLTYPSHRDKVFFTGNTMNDRLTCTRKMAQKIRNAGYELIEKWERDFDREVRTNADLKRFLDTECEEILNIKPLDPRDSFYGGRTCNNVKVVDCSPDEKARYYDFCSLYPYINKRGVYFIGHPEIFVGQAECSQLVGSEKDISRVQGLIMCDILPPRNLYHGLLPLKMHRKLLFPLCRKCCEEKYQ